QEGKTPNPCVICNKEIKFGLLLKKLPELNSDYLATGHYACLKKSNTGYELLKAKDKAKDQTYFLYNLKQKELQKVLFPIGNYLKEDIRNMTKEFNIANLIVPESKNLCFINGITKNYLKKHLTLKPGLILDKNGIKIGKHKGLPLYTIGQRKEIKVSGFLPYYVLRLDFKNNALIVTNDERDLYEKELIVEKVNWISGKEPRLPKRIKAKIRYLHPSSSAEITSKTKKGYLVKFIYAQRAITSGQSIVFYDKKNILGGGTIK
ncbi:MAG: tRNA 2-thiouridine(34) synthase MnmA, partial [Patescibacteria group bacterium]|nr:tRNA 2-thiouridine(34) synthase MnmA [Patescibacteria group bacterium]